MRADVSKNQFRVYLVSSVVSQQVALEFDNFLFPFRFTDSSYVQQMIHVWCVLKSEKTKDSTASEYVNLSESSPKDVPQSTDAPWPRVRQVRETQMLKDTIRKS